MLQYHCVCAAVVSTPCPAIELHLATSLLSRVALLRALLPRLHRNSRCIAPHLTAHTLTSQFAFSIFIMSSHGEDNASSPSTLNPPSSTSYAPFDHNSNIIAANEALVLYCRRSPFPPIFQNSKPLIILSQRAGGQTPQSSIWLGRRRWRV
jgi:hypothetical protein